MTPVQSGEVDECGVCDGVGNSCAVTLQLEIDVSPSLIYGDSIEVGGWGWLVAVQLAGKEADTGQT